MLSDQPRAVSRFGNDRRYRVESAKLLGTVLHMLQGTPYVYQGEELGMPNYPFATLADFLDIESVNYARTAAGEPGYDEAAMIAALATGGRDNARTPVQWDDSTNAGFTTGTPWLPVNPNYGEVNAVAAVADEGSVYHYYQELIALRHQLPVIVYGDFELLLDEDEYIFAYTRTCADDQLLVVANFSDEPHVVEIAEAEDWAAQSVLIGNYPAESFGAGLALQPWEARVYRRSI